jgi:hypothetical protein
MDYSWVWFFLVGGPSSSARSGEILSDTRCLEPQSYAAGGNRSYLDFLSISDDPRYQGTRSRQYYSWLEMLFQ